MAHSPKKKAQAVSDLTSTDLGWDEVAKRYGISKSTLSAWVRQAKADISESPGGSKELSILPSRDEQKAAFTSALMKLLFKSIVMLDTWAETCADPTFIKAQPAECNELGRTVLTYADRLVPFISEGDQGKS